jgi:hypothetical protein
MYESKTLTSTRSTEESLRVFERKMLQRIFGAVCENGLWPIIMNYINYFLNWTLLKTIKIGRL